MIETDVDLKEIGVSVDHSPAGLKICPHIDKEQSTIHFNNLTPLVQHLQRSGSTNQTLPVSFTLTPHLEKGDELTGSISAECAGNIGGICAYAQPLMKKRMPRLLLGVLKCVCSKMHFKLHIDQVPIRKGNINVGNLMQHTSIEVNIKGHVSWLFKPVLAIVQWGIGVGLHKRFSSGNSGVVDTQGYVSLTQLLAKNRIYISDQQNMQPVVLPVATSHVRTAFNCLKLHQPLPDDWDQETFLVGVITELERIYGKGKAQKKELMDIASNFVNKYDYPETQEEFDSVLQELAQMEKFKQAHPEVISPMKHYLGETIESRKIPQSRTHR